MIPLEAAQATNGWDVLTLVVVFVFFGFVLWLMTTIR
jgi:hypothetical protein